MKAIDELRLNCIKLHDIGKKLHLKYGTDSYELRCELFDIRKDLETLKEQLKEQRELCEGKCGMNYCDDNGCIDRKRNLVEPKDNTEHCG